MYLKKFSTLLPLIIFSFSLALAQMPHEDINLDPPVYPDDDPVLTLPESENYDAPHSLRKNQDNRVDQLEDEVRFLKGEIENLKHQLKSKPEAVPEKSTQKETTIPSNASIPDLEEEESMPTLSSKEKTALQIYEEAQDYLSQQAYPEAERLLKEIIDHHPDSPLIINTRYWLGEIYYVQKDYKRAAIVFAEVYKSYRALKKENEDSQSKIKGVKGRFSKVPEALLKLALSLKALDKASQVCTALEQLHNEFPEMPHSIKKRVEKLEQELPQCKIEDNKQG